MQLVQLAPQAQKELCFYCKRAQALYLSLFFGKPVCSITCGQLLYMEWYENERYTDTPYNIFEQKHPLA